MSFDFVSTFAKDFGDKLKIDKEKEKQNDLMDIDEVDSRPELTAQSVESKKTIKPIEKKKTIKTQSHFRFFVARLTYFAT